MADGYLAFAACHLAWTAAVVAVARGLHRAVGRGSEARRTHGRYVLGWAVGGFAAGPPAAVAAFFEEPPEGVAAVFLLSYMVGMFSLLAGWAVGMVHGGLALAWRRSGSPTGVGDAEPGAAAGGGG